MPLWLQSQSTLSETANQRCARRAFVGWIERRRSRIQGPPIEGSRRGFAWQFMAQAHRIVAVGGHQLQLVDGYRLQVVYPESDGVPMGETEWHVFLLTRLLHALSIRFDPQPEVHVGANLFIYHEEGKPSAVLCPDLFVAFQAKPGLRRTWKTWEEGFFPQVIIELASASTRVNDLGGKRGTYEALGVLEYFVVDPLGELEGPRLRGWRRNSEGAFETIEVESGHTSRTLRSRELGLLLQEEEGDSLRLIDGKTGQPLLFPAEEAEARQREAEARKRAEAEVEQLRRQLERVRRGS